jgi:hypothetical protein
MQISSIRICKCELFAYRFYPPWILVSNGSYVIAGVKEAVARIIYQEYSITA